MNIRALIHILCRGNGDWVSISLSVGFGRDGCGVAWLSCVGEVDDRELDPCGAVRTNGRVIVISYGAH
jgi:hypothetical protein